MGNRILAAREFENAAQAVRNEHPASIASAIDDAMNALFKLGLDRSGAAAAELRALMREWDDDAAKAA